MLVIAHAADWVSLAFFVPVIGFVVWLALNQLRERRGESEEGPDSPSNR